MSHSAIAILITLTAAFSGWLRNGSVMPMAFSLPILLASLSASLLLRRASLSVRTKRHHLAPSILSGASLYLAIRLDQTGQHFDISPPLPGVFHLGIALLWWLSSDLILRSGTVSGPLRNYQALVGLAGGLLLLSAPVPVGEGCPSPWLYCPFAAFPLATCAANALLPSHPAFKTILFTIVPASIILSGLLVAANTAADEVRFARGSKYRDQPSAEPDRIYSGEESGVAKGPASRHLPRNADIRFTGKTMVYLRAHSPELFQSWRNSPLYVRTYSLALFESDEVISAIRSGRWIYDTDDGSEDNSVTLKASISPSTSLYTAYVSSGSAGHLPAPVTTSNLRTSAVYEFADDWYQLTPPGDVTHLQYKGTAITPPVLDESPGSGPDRLKQSNAPSIYLNLPPSPLSSRIRELSAGFDQNDPLGSIRNHLRTKAEYSLRFATPADSSPVEDFLFGSRKGHCEHYAAATVLLLRSLGIPSRLSYGYAGGSVDSRQRIVAFRDSDFHAWAEIMTPDQNGWLIFDTTPGASGTVPRPPIPASLPILAENAYHDFSALSSSTVFASNRLEGRIGAFLTLLSENFGSASLIGLILVVLLGRILKVRRRRNAEQALPVYRAKSQAAVRPRYIDELILSAKDLGFHRKPGHTIKDLITGVSRHRSLPDEIHSAVSYYYSVTYCGRDPDPAAENRFLKLVRNWSRDARSD